MENKLDPTATIHCRQFNTSWMLDSAWTQFGLSWPLNCDIIWSPIELPLTWSHLQLSRWSKHSRKKSTKLDKPVTPLHTCIVACKTHASLFICFYKMHAHEQKHAVQYRTCSLWCDSPSLQQTKEPSVLSSSFKLDRSHLKHMQLWRDIKSTFCVPYVLGVLASLAMDPLGKLTTATNQETYCNCPLGWPNSRMITEETRTKASHKPKESQWRIGASLHFAEKWATESAPPSLKTSVVSSGQLHF